MCLARSPWCMFLHCAKLLSGNHYGYVGAVNEAKTLVLRVSKKIDKHLVGHLELLSSVHVFLFIRKTCPCNEYPLKPHFDIVKLAYAGVYLFFLFLLQNID